MLTLLRLWAMVREVRKTRPFPTEQLPEKDHNGIYFGTNCVHIAQCRAHNSCFGTCKQY